MSFSVKEHEQSLRWHLESFVQSYEYHKGKQGEFDRAKVIDRYLKNEIDMENGWADYHKYLQDVSRRDNRLLMAIKTVKGNAFYKNICLLLKECECTRGEEPLIIVQKPEGKFIDEKYGREIKGYHCVQWSQGTEGDSYAGYIYIKIREGKYLKASFSC